jgi:hypothetical protein
MLHKAFMSLIPLGCLPKETLSFIGLAAKLQQRRRGVPVYLACARFGTCSL